MFIGGFDTLILSAVVFYTTAVGQVIVHSAPDGEFDDPRINRLAIAASQASCLVAGVLDNRVITTPDLGHSSWQAAGIDFDLAGNR